MSDEGSSLNPEHEISRSFYYPDALPLHNTLKEKLKNRLR
jgi:hypothetical protein